MLWYTNDIILQTRKIRLLKKGVVDNRHFSEYPAPRSRIRYYFCAAHQNPRTIHHYT